MRLKNPALCRDWDGRRYITWLAVPPEWTEMKAVTAFKERYGRGR